MSTIDVRGLGHTFGDLRVLKDVSLQAPGGTFASIVGPSACGKSTLLRVLAGLLVPDEGTAEVGGVSTVSRPGLVSYMPQKDLLLPWRRVLGNATLGAEVGGIKRAEAKRQAGALMERFGLAGFERAWPSQLSGGMRQRLALLRTFLAPAKTMLLDEPFGALDAITRREMHGWLQSVLGAEQRTVLFITHDVEEALLLSDRVYVMSPRPGRIIADVPVTFPKPRPSGAVLAPEFIRLKAELLGALGG
ncbi:MAG: ABC transporter ATP-binding protein [Dehalococcoidia bacterium]|nr:ABC transporter ATP-binding protein [Dehalococcoidia bacterium]MCB9485421.1 ABC transporter ATP-binding protein [Thermoflexaceae bacterium]